MTPTMPGSTPSASHGEISERLWIANAAAIDSTPKAEARTLSPIWASRLSESTMTPKR